MAGRAGLLVIVALAVWLAMVYHNRATEMEEALGRPITALELAQYDRAGRSPAEVRGTTPPTAEQIKAATEHGRKFNREWAALARPNTPVAEVVRDSE
jgi:hypothetical protein